MNQKITVSDVLALELARAKVDRVFGIVSIHNVLIYDALARHGGFKVVKARGESGAVNMADAYSRISGQLGVVITSTGAGAGNAAGALIEADAAGSQVLHITGQVPNEYIGKGRGYIHECRDQLTMLKSISKHAYRLSRPEEISSMIRIAIGEMFKAPTGPVSVEIPVDYQSRIIKPIQPNGCEALVDCEDIPDVREVAAAILGSERPVVWAGSGVLRGEGVPEFGRLVELVDAAVITSQAARGVFSEKDSRCLGFFATDPDVRELLSSSDLLVSVGTRFRGNETGFWGVDLPKNHIGIDVDPLSVNRNYSHSMSLIGNSGPILSALVSMIEKEGGRPKPLYREEIRGVRQSSRIRMRKTLGPYEEILDSIRDNLPEDGIVVRDVTIPTTTWASRLLEVTAPRQTLHSVTVGIGQALPMAIGASMAGRPERRIVALVGDGGFLVNMGELAVIKEEGLCLTVVVFDDGGYGVLRNLQNEVFEGRKIGVDLRSPDFVGIAHSFGLEAVCVSKGEQFNRALKEALDSNSSCVIVINTEKLGTTSKRFSGTPPLDLYRPSEDE